MANVHEQNQKALQAIMRDLTAKRRSVEKLQEKLDTAQSEVNVLSDKLANAALAYKNGDAILYGDSNADNNVDGGVDGGENTSESA